jgi:Spy/CpxP family protein refolding chaperone
VKVKYRNVVIAMCLLALGCVGLAQELAASSAKLQKLESMMQPLNLTPDQKAKVLPIFKEEAPRIEAIKFDTSLTGGEKLQQFRSVHEETDAQLKPILSREQYAKLQQIRQQQIQEAIRRRRAGQQP